MFGWTDITPRTACGSRDSGERLRSGLPLRLAEQHSTILPMTVDTTRAVISAVKQAGHFGPQLWREVPLLYCCVRNPSCELCVPVRTRLWNGQKIRMGRLVGFEPTTSRTTIWRYYRLSYSRRTDTSLTSDYRMLIGSTSMTSVVAFHFSRSAKRRKSLTIWRNVLRLAALIRI